METWLRLLEQYGYVAVFIGSFLEGETVVALAGFFASRHHLEIVLVVLVAFAGAYVGHVFWYFLGKTQGLRLLNRFPKLRKQLERGLTLIAKHGPAAIFVSQYIYGFRIAAAIAFGMSEIRLRTFILYQALSCVIWAIVISSLGFFFGELLQTLLGRVEQIELYATLTIVVIGLVIWYFHRKQEAKEETG